MTAKIIVSQYISLDGVIQDPVGMENSGLGDWIGPFTRGPQGDRFKHDELFSASALLLGRTTYDGFAAVWPLVKDEEGFADRINAMTKFVASNSLSEAAWNNTMVLSGDVAAKVRELKETLESEILIYGSAGLVHSLMPAGLSDQYNLMIYPTVLGRGTRLFPQGYSVGQMTLIDALPFNDGIVHLRYAA
ncbi:Dihydrofolate reductase [Xaviernesmea oryzae]|uniref:Dihydrofolate reductase n=1 Tax=Xaviernesmea oryzae TaxID=464029 RepID=A0A1X7CV41_9HYPH|nr:dihydrofolate reductase family protein [Xaviernesmea oryzae]SMF03654.1 Dihydrofolate reductase [Xaviernesmea oryzae]